MIVITTQLSLNECIDRIQHATGGHGLSGGFLKGSQMIGAVHHRTVHLRTTKGYYSNSFSPEFVGQFIEIGGITLLVGRFRRRPIILALIYGISAILIFMSIYGQSLIPLLFLVLFGLFILVGFGLAKDEESQIVAWLCTTLEATITAPANP